MPASRPAESCLAGCTSIARTGLGRWQGGSARCQAVPWSLPGPTTRSNPSTELPATSTCPAMWRCKAQVVTHCHNRCSISKLRIHYPLHQLVVGGGQKVWISPSWVSTRKQTAVRQFVSKREFYVLVDLTNRRSYKSYIPQFHKHFLLFHNHLQNSIFQICLPDINIWF